MTLHMPLTSNVPQLQPDGCVIVPVQHLQGKVHSNLTSIIKEQQSYHISHMWISDRDSGTLGRGWGVHKGRISEEVGHG